MKTIIFQNQIKDVTNWINVERIFLTLVTFYYIINLYNDEFDFEMVAKILHLIFDVYCYICIMSLREDYQHVSVPVALP